jgi:hypothetical protein
LTKKEAENLIPVVTVEIVVGQNGTLFFIACIFYLQLLFHLRVAQSIVITGLAMVGTCLLTTLIILLLHIRERRQDRHAKLQDTNRFHFDAM